MKKIFEITKMKKLSLAVAAAGMFGMSGANAVEFNFGELRAQIDNNISYGVSMRTEKPDAGQVMPQNGAQFGINGKGSSYNYDDGTLNYKRGDVYSNVLKWSGDLEIGTKTSVPLPVHVLGMTKSSWMKPHALKNITMPLNPMQVRALKF